MTREELYELALEALKQGGTAGAGAADELLFGGPSRAFPEQFKSMEEERPTALTAGRVGSMFVPYGGVLGAARLVKDAPRIAKAYKGAKALGSGSVDALLSKVPEAVRMARVADSPFKPGAVGAIQRLANSFGGGALEAGGQALGRNVVGGEDNDVLGQAGWGGLTGGGVGLLSLAGRGIGKKLYRSPMIYDPNSGPQANKYLDQSMDMGRWGGEDYFRGKAAQDYEDYGQKMSPLREKIAGDVANPDDIFKLFNKTISDEKKIGGNALNELQKKLSSSQSSLAEFPTYEGAGELRDIANKKLSNLKPGQRMAAIFGLGGVSDEAESIGALKRSIDAAEENQIIKRFGPEAKQTMDSAKDSYGRSKAFSKALNSIRGEQAPMQFPATATGIGIAVKDPATLARVAGASGGFIASRALPVRTKAGVALNKLGQTPERASAFIERGKATYSSPSASEKKEASDFQKELDAIDSKPAKKNPRKVSRYNVDLNDPDVKDIMDIGIEGLE